MKKYTSYEMGETMTKEDWLKWYDQNGDKENFASREDWFLENVKMQNLNEI